MTLPSRVCLIGFGEVGQTIAGNLRGRGVRDVVAWDVLFEDPSSIPRRAINGSGVRVGNSAADALADARIVISAVTAAECIATACSAARSLAAEAVYFDLNSVSPTTRLEAAALIGAGRGRYIEAAVMSPIAPKGIASPMLFGGPYAAACLPLARELGFLGAEVFSDSVGRASAAKMCRSIMIKGIEALLTESLLAARRYGVEGAVLESLNDLLPVGDWRALSHYMISRSLQHGRRRAAEIREVASAVREAGLQPWMSEASAERHDWAANLAAANGQPSLESVLDTILAGVPNPHGAL